MTSRRRPRDEPHASPAAAGRPPAAAADGEAAGERSHASELQRKYAALAEKYRCLVERAEAETTRASSVTMLALAAMRAGATALAAIREGGFIVRNDRWLRLAGERGAPWRPAGTPASPSPFAPREHTSIEGIALAEAEALARSGENVRTGRYERGASEEVVELRLERARLDAPPVVLAMVSDVTERVRTEREVERMRATMEAQERLRAVGELASGVAHDLNNTLHALRLRLSRLGGPAGGCAGHAEDLRVLERIAADAGARLRKLQDLARRREDVPDERVDLAAVAADAVEVAHLDRPDAGGRVAVELAVPALPHVVGNSAELRHVLVNLFLNARDAMPGGGTISVSGRVAAGGDVQVIVEDQGNGIPPENLDRIFHPFFTTKGRRGTGLGLSMAAGVVRRLGGDIRADNRPDGGARFTLRFPPAPSVPPVALDGSPASAPAKTSAQPPARTPAQTREEIPARRVLVVDDDPDNLDAMQLVLEGSGHHVEVTDSGLDAVARVEAGERYDTVLCDLGLGDTTGWEVAARIGAAAPGTRILLVTGWAEEIAPDDPRRGYVSAVMGKPLGLDDLDEILRPQPAGDGSAAPRPTGPDAPRERPPPGHSPLG